MGDTYTQVYIQFVFAVKRREALIPQRHKNELHHFIGGQILKRKAKPIAIHCMPDHIHIFVGFPTTMSLADFVKEIKVNSTQFINSKGWINKKFQWQEGFGAFTYTRSLIPIVARYIENQEEHHKKQNFRQEYLTILRRNGVEFDTRGLFEFFD